MADIFVRSKSGFVDVVSLVVEFGLFVVERSVFDGDWAAVAGMELGDSAIVFLLQESKALGIVASTPQARMAEEYRAKARP